MVGPSALRPEQDAEAPEQGKRHGSLSAQARDVPQRAANQHMEVGGEKHGKQRIEEASEEGESSS